MINKRISINDVLVVNRELAKYPIQIRYNFIAGFPTETVEELDETLGIMETLMATNSNVGTPFLNIYTPYPGTPLYQKALECGFKPPSSTEGWSTFTWSTASSDWISPTMKKRLEKLSREHFETSTYLK